MWSNTPVKLRSDQIRVRGERASFNSRLDSFSVRQALLRILLMLHCLMRLTRGQLLYEWEHLGRKLLAPLAGVVPRSGCWSAA